MFKCVIVYTLLEYSPQQRPKETSFTMTKRKKNLYFCICIFIHLFSMLALLSFHRKFWKSRKRTLRQDTFSEVTLNAARTDCLAETLLKGTISTLYIKMHQENRFSKRSDSSEVRSWTRILKVTGSSPAAEEDSFESQNR